jgi:hypothetical protein
MDPLYVWIAVAAVVTFVVGTAGGALCVLWLPADYFDSRNVVSRTTPCLNSFWSWAVFVGRNVVGTALIIAGLVMLVIPGPGFLAVAVGAVLVDFPGKHRLISKLLARPHVLGAANAWRRKFDKPPLRAPQHAH